MSKLIVEMEMPRACPCELATEIEWNFYPCFAYYGVVERAVEFDKCMSNGKRPDWCPIKGVLPDEHGDLIDRDATIDFMKTEDVALYTCFDSDDAYYSVTDAITILMMQNTIISAERKDDEKSC